MSMKDEQEKELLQSTEQTKTKGNVDETSEVANVTDEVENKEKKEEEDKKDASDSNNEPAKEESPKTREEEEVLQDQQENKKGEEQQEAQSEEQEVESKEEPASGESTGVDEVEENNNNKEEEETTKDDTEDLKKQLVELQDKEVERELAQRDVEASNHMANVVAKAQEAFRQTLAQYQIPMDKPLDEIAKENPSQAAIIESVYNKAVQVIQAEQARVTESVRAAKEEATLKRAARYFGKYDLSSEEKIAAADTFAEIMNTVGVKDLGEDLKRKVHLCVADAKMKVANTAKTENKIDAVEDVMEEVVEGAESKQERGVNEQLLADTVDQALEQDKQNAEDLEVELQGNIPSCTSAPKVSIDNVMAMFENTPSRERAKFYKEYRTLIDEAMRKM